MVGYFIRVNREIQRLRAGEDDTRSIDEATDPEKKELELQQSLHDVHSGYRSNTCVTMQSEITSIEFWRAVISECLGTFFYVFLASLSLFRWDSESAGVVQVAFTFGFAVASLVQCFGHISGGHLNPAITLAMLFTGKISPLRGIVYVVAQCGGAIAGAASLYGTVPEEYREGLGATVLQAGVTAVQGFTVEFLMTFILTFTFFATLDRNRREHAYSVAPLSIGVVVTMDHLIGVKLTGCGINPARSLGPAFIKSIWRDHWVYWAGPVAGGVVAGIMYVYIFDPQRIPKPIYHVTERSSDSDKKSPSDQNVYGFSSIRRNQRLRHSRRSTRSAPGSISRSRGQENGAYDFGSRLSYLYGGSSRSSRRNRIPYLLGDVSENEVSNHSEPEYNTIDSGVRKY